MSIISDDNDSINTNFKADKNPVTKPDESENDSFFENSIRPKDFNSYIGQANLLKHLKITIEASRKREKALDHILFYGPPGLGKTTLAGVIGNEMGVPVKITSAPALERPRDIIGILMSLEENQILFIDEIHRLNKVAEEILYPAMEDFYLDMTTGKAQTVKTLRIPLPKFTLIGATTKAGELSGPLRDRFGIVHRLEFYTPDELSKVIQRTAKLLDIEIDEKSAYVIARRSRGTPRIANRLIKRVGDYALVKNDGKITEDINYGLVIPEAQKICINTFEEGIQLKDIGEEKRQYKDTLINEYSSRSHTIFQLYLETSIQDKEKNTFRNKYSLLNLVDLAGSERINNTDKNIPNNNNETGYINKSLFALSNVINKLSENKNNYIPYRDSKLTRLLSKGLGGGSLVTIICNISPSANNFFQTVSTLRFANRAKHIKIKPAINERIIKKYKEKSENKNIIIEKNDNGGYNIFNNNIYNILNQSGSESNEPDNKNFEMKYYALLLKNKKLIAENNKLKNTIEELIGNNNIGENFIDVGIEKIKELLVKYKVDKEFDKFIDNNLKGIKMNYINQIKSFQITTMSKLNEIQNIIIQNFNSIDSSENNSEEKNKELFSEVDLNFNGVKNINEVKLLYEQKEKQLESLMKKYKENTDYYFDSLLNKNNNKNNLDIIYKEHQEKINELEKLYEKAQNSLEQKFFEKLKNITNFNKQNL